MIGWEICVRHGFMGLDDLAIIEQMNTKLSRFYLDVNRAPLTRIRS